MFFSTFATKNRTGLASRIYAVLRAVLSDTMEGPFQLAERVVEVLIKQRGPAVFLLRRIDETPAYAYYRGFVGRTGSDLAQALEKWFDSDYRVFWFAYAVSAAAAFEEQCRLWHELGGPAGKLDNEDHPQAAGTHLVRCPSCAP